MVSPHACRRWSYTSQTRAGSDPTQGQKRSQTMLLEVTNLREPLGGGIVVIPTFHVKNSQARIGELYLPSPKCMCSINSTKGHGVAPKLSPRLLNEVIPVHLSAILLTSTSSRHRHLPAGGLPTSRELDSPGPSASRKATASTFPLVCNRHVLQAVLIPKPWKSGVG